MAINWRKKEGNSIADDEKRHREEGDPGKCYEKPSMPEVKLYCGKGMRAMALERVRARWSRTMGAPENGGGGGTME